MLLESATDLASKMNRFDFTKASGLCIYPRLQRDWEQHGSQAFEYEVLETIKKPEAKNIKEFGENIALLARYC